MSQAEYYMIKGVVAEQPQERQDAIKSAYDRIKAIMDEDDEVGRIAAALVVMEVEREETA